MAATATPANQANTAPTAKAAQTVSAVEEVDPAAQTLGAEGGSDTTPMPDISMSMDKFFELTNRAGMDVPNDDIVAAVSNLNFY